MYPVSLFLCQNYLSSLCQIVMGSNRSNRCQSNSNRFKILKCNSNRLNIFQCNSNSNRLAIIDYKSDCVNSAVVCVLRSGKTRYSYFGACAHNVWYVATTSHIDLQYTHIRDVDNKISDALSR